MADQSWLLNHRAIRQAKACINIVQSELGVKLTLSHPQFMDMLSEYIDLTDSIELAQAYNDLAAFTDGSIAKKSVPLMTSTASDSVVRMPGVSMGGGTAGAVAVSESMDAAVDEKILYHGKYYLKYSEGKQFQGLYRGQPRYA